MMLWVNWLNNKLDDKHGPLTVDLPNVTSRSHWMHLDAEAGAGEMVQLLRVSKLQSLLPRQVVLLQSPPLGPKQLNVFCIFGFGSFA